LAIAIITAYNVFFPCAFAHRFAAIDCDDPDFGILKRLELD
jgi:hypothetical protein